MATLTGKKISESYKDLLQVSNSNAGVDGTLRDIEDGEGTSSVLQISSSSINIKNDGALQINETAITSTASELNILDGVTATTAELNYVDGVTSNIQTQLDSKVSATLTQEQVEDFVGGMLDGTETGISVSYDDTDGNIDFVVATQSDNNFTTTLLNKLNAIEASATADQTDEEIQDIVGAMFTSTNTETGITATYQDATGDIDLVVGTLNQDTTGNAATATKIASITNSDIVQLTDTQTLSNKTLASPAFTGDINFTDASTPQFTVTDTTNSISVRLDADNNAGRIGTSSDHNLMIRRNSVNHIQLYSAYTMHNQGGNDIDFRAKDSSGNVVFKVDAGTSKTEISTLDVSGDADIDGTLEADAITVNGTALNTVIAGVTVANATLAATATVSDSTANTNFPVVFHDESNGLLDDTGALRYNPSTGELLVPKLTVAGTTTTVDTVTMNAANAVKFEGATADANETILSIVDPTNDDNTQYLLNASGYIPLLAAATTTTISSTPAELNVLDGYTGSVTELNYLDTLHATGVTDTEFDYLDGVTSNIQTQLDSKIEATLTTEQVQDIAGGMFSSNTETGITASYVDGDGTIDLTVNYLPATDDRDVKPNAITTSGVKQVRAYFTTLEGLTGSAGNDYQDLLVLDTYSDGTGGDMNALAFDKSEQKIRHYLADQSDTSWGTAKVLAYEDTFTAGTGIDISSTTISVDVSDFMSNGADNRVLTATGTDAMNAESNLTFDGNNLAIASDGILYFGGGSHTFIREVSDDNLTIAVGGTNLLDLVEDSTDYVRVRDNTLLGVGSSNDMNLKHNGTNSFITNGTGALYIDALAQDEDFFIRVNDGGSTITAMSIDSSAVGTVRLPNDSQQLIIGAGDDLRIQHNGSHSFIQQYGTGDLYIDNTIDDKSIVFRTDDGSGGVTTYLKIDGSATTINVAKNMMFADDVKAYFGNSSDAYIYYEPTNDELYIRNANGDTKIRNEATDADIIFSNDDGSGGNTNYMVLDGGEKRTYFYEQVRVVDSKQFAIGSGDDLELKHDGSNSTILNHTGN